MTAHELAAMMDVPRWLLWRGVPDPDKPGKTKKIPISPISGNACDPTDDEHHVDYATAYAILQRGGVTGLAFSFVETDGFWFFDIDNCAVNGEWSPLAQDIMRRLTGCAIEVSQSRTGLHLFGRGHVGEHSCRNIPLGLELYTDRRFCAITFNGLVGDAGTDHSAAIQQIVAEYFPPNAAGRDVSGWTTEPRNGWDTSLADDDNLIERATKTGENNNAAARFGYNDGKATFGDLWTLNAEVLAKVYPGNSSGGYDGSSVDAALASHLCWWTGHDMERVERLMRQSRLVRPKWDERPEYLETTIIGASAAVGDKMAWPRAGSVDTESNSVATGAGAEGDTKSNIVIRTLARLNVTARYDMRHRAFELCLPEPMLWKGRMVGCLPLDDDAIRQMCRMVAPAVKASVADVDQAIKTMGGLDKYDPVIDYFEALQWDGTPRLDGLLVDYCGAGDNALNRAYGRHFMLGAVARAYCPGCAHDEVLALTGNQGIGKSRFTRILGGEWHSDAPVLGLDSQKVIERIGGALIHEIAEIQLVGRSGEQVKAFLSTTHHTARAAYGRVTEKIPARWVYVSTGNDEQFLNDMTGNRRWHVVEVKEARLDELRRDRDQLWGEAVAAFKALHPNWQGLSAQEKRIAFPRELWAAQAATAEQARLRDPWEDMIPEALRTGRIVCQPTTAEAIFPVAGFVPTGTLLQFLHTPGGVHISKRLANVCDRLGWIPHRQRMEGGQNSRGYLIPASLFEGT